MFTHRKLIVIIAGLILLLLLIVMGIVLVSQKPSQDTSSLAQFPKTQKFAPRIPQVTSLPRISDEKGGGIDTQNQIVMTSQNNLAILAPKLPFSKQITTGDGIAIEIIIPTQELVMNEWTLLVNIFGPDYQIPETDPLHDSMKRAFLTGAEEVFLFLEQNNIDPQNVIIQWGDRRVTTVRSELWLGYKQ
mgnify:CR=1 FL=1